MFELFQSWRRIVDDVDDDGCCGGGDVLSHCSGL